ncbi:MAG: M28 family peptidase, partial [Planctomycetota bacterium]
LLKRSDHWNFIQKGIPSIFIFGGFHPQYHTEHDDVQLISRAKMVNIARLMFLFAYESANHTGTFKYE